MKPEIDRRRGIAATTMRSLWQPLWRHRSISIKTKLRIYNTAILPILLYGAETWPLNKTMAARIDGFDSRSLRAITNTKWYDRVSNEVLRERTQQPPASLLAAQRRLRWFGHIHRLPPEHPTRSILEFNPRTAGWKRPRGRPRTRWLDVIRQDLEDLGVPMEHAPRLAENRTWWRALVNSLVSTQDANARPPPYDIDN